MVGLDVLWYYYIMVNVVLFVLMGIDKSKAIRHAWRIPEKMLLGIGVIGGAVGGLLGMLVFRHKTRKWYFVLTFVAAIALHVWLIKRILTLS